jgi:hypothetical protein
MALRETLLLLATFLVVPFAFPAQTADMPDWQNAAGGKMEFDAASVREDPSGKFHPPPFSMDTDNGYINAGGLFSADLSAAEFIALLISYPCNTTCSRICLIGPAGSSSRFRRGRRQTRLRTRCG